MYVFLFDSFAVFSGVLLVHWIWRELNQMNAMLGAGYFDVGYSVQILKEMRTESDT